MGHDFFEDEVDDQLTYRVVNLVEADVISIAEARKKLGLPKGYDG